MVTLHFRNENGLWHTCEVQRAARLSIVQHRLCKLFGQRFPKMKASLTVRGTCFDDFLEQPFLEASHGDIVNVTFERTDDPYFYDLADRMPTKSNIDLESECVSEEASAMVSVEEHRKPSTPKSASTRSDPAAHVAIEDDDPLPDETAVSTGQQEGSSS